MVKPLTFRLGFMMLLQFFIWGAWLPLIFGYLPSLDFSSWQQACILNAFPVAAIIGMFFSNQFADRNFAAEKFLAFSHLIGGAAILGCGFVTGFPSRTRLRLRTLKIRRVSFRSFGLAVRSDGFLLHGRSLLFW